MFSLDFGYIFAAYLFAYRAVFYTRINRTFTNLPEPQYDCQLHTGVLTREILVQ